MALPCPTPDLQNDYKNAKKEALKVYRQRAIDSESKGENSVNLECKKIYDMVKIRNDEICTAACTDFLNQYHSEIMMSLNAQGSADSPIFTTLDQVEAALLQIEQTFEQGGPSGDQNKRQLIYEKFRS